MSETTVIECPHCGASFKAKSKAALGKKVACPKCQAPFVISGAKSPARKSKPEPQASAQSGAWNDMWDDEDEFDESPAPRARSAPARSRSRGRQQSSEKNMMWIGLVAILVVVVGGIGLIAVNSGSSGSQEKEPSENLAAALMTREQSAEATPEDTAQFAPGMSQTDDAKAKSPVPDNRQTSMASTKPQESPVSLPGQNQSDKPSDPPANAQDHLLIFEIVSLKPSLKLMSEKSRESSPGDDFFARTEAEGVDRRLLREKVTSYVPGSAHIDLEKKLLSLQADPGAAKQLAKIINENPVGSFKISAVPQVTTLDLPEDRSEDLNYSINYEIKQLEESFQKQVAANPTAGAKVLTQLLNHQLQQAIPTYIPDSLQLNLEYRKMTIHLTEYPARTLLQKIIQIPSIPVKLGPIYNSIRELRTPDQLKPTQVTFKIAGHKFPRMAASQLEHSYLQYRKGIFRDLHFALTNEITGFVPGTLEINYVDQTVTFQLDHEPGKYLAKRINNAATNHTILADEPLKTGPPGPPTITPGRPMRLVVLKVLESEFAGQTYYRDLNPDQLKLRLSQEGQRLNSALYGDVSGYIYDSAEVDPEQMLIAFQLDRLPPADLAKVLDSLIFFNFKVAEKPEAVHEVQYDPESSEKTIFFRFTDHSEKSPYFGPDFIRDRVNDSIASLPHYIPNSLQMDFDQGTFTVRLRIGGHEQGEINSIVRDLEVYKLEVTDVKTTPPQGKGNAHPKGIGIVAGSAADRTQNSSMVNSAGKLAEGKHLKVTIQYGLYGGRQKVSRSAQVALDGFAWVDLKTLKVDPAKKEITFHTTGEMNVAALERLLKRQKFFQVVLKSEKLPETETPEN